MKTTDLAVYLIAFVAVVAVLAGVVPPLMNAHSTVLNALGLAVALSAVLAAVLTAHATFTKSLKEKR